MANTFRAYLLVIEMHVSCDLVMLQSEAIMSVIIRHVDSTETCTLLDLPSGLAGVCIHVCVCVVLTHSLRDMGYLPQMDTQSHSGKQTVSQSVNQANRHTDRKAGGQIDRQEDRQTNTSANRNLSVSQLLYHLLQ